MSAGTACIAAERFVLAPPAAVFGFLADLENHWLLADRFVEVLTIERPAAGGPAHRGTVRIRAPLGLRRTARTRVVQAAPPGSIAGTASLGRGTEVDVRWTLVPVPRGTRVRLEATIRRAAWDDRMLLGMGGRRWLQRRFESILETLARQLGEDAGQAPSA